MISRNSTDWRATDYIIYTTLGHPASMNILTLLVQAKTFRYTFLSKFSNWLDSLCRAWITFDNIVEIFLAEIFVGSDWSKQNEMCREISNLIFSPHSRCDKLIYSASSLFHIQIILFWESLSEITVDQSVSKNRKCN